MVPPIPLTPLRGMSTEEELGDETLHGFIAHRCALREVDVKRVIQSLAWVAGSTLSSGHTFSFGGSTTIKLKTAFNEEFGTFMIIKNDEKKDDFEEAAEAMGEEFDGEVFDDTNDVEVVN